MTAKIIPIRKVTILSKNLKKQGQTIVLVGGCFDLLHLGHVTFLEKAKKMGNNLIVLLESDEKVMELKGIARPIHTQRERARILSALEVVDYVALLPYLKNNSQYDQLIGKIRPDVIAATSGDVNILHHKRSAKLTGAKLKLVTKMIGNYSTSRILNH